MSARIDSLLKQMTLPEKITLLAGADMWHTVPNERLGIPAIKTTDGPLGARGADMPSAPTSACFPCGTALAATWNPELVRRVGAALAEDVRSKGAHVLLAPTVNIHRSPLAGRNFECYSEDPYLTSEMATAYITGLQSGGVGACIKHFVCNDSEFERMSISSEVGERPLREIYLRPFQIAIRRAKPRAVMSSYNRLNGTYASENSRLLLDILKDEWGFDGIVISDWYGTYSGDVARGGLDLEMPGPARFMGEPTLEAVRNGQVSEEMIDDKVRRLLRTFEKLGVFEHPEIKPEQAIDKPEQREIARAAASEAIVLLKNRDALLPLDVKSAQSIAVIGPVAKNASIMGGGSVRVHPHYVVSPLEAITQRGGARVRYAPGCSIDKMPRLLDRAWMTEPMTLAYYDNRELAGEPVRTEKTQKARLEWNGAKLESVTPSNFSARLTGTFTVPESGTYDVGIGGIGNMRLLMDGATVIDLWHASGFETKEVVSMDLVAGRPYQLQADFATKSDLPWRGFGVAVALRPPADALEQAVALAKQSDVAILCVGLTDQWESEGFDRVDMDLPGAQNELIERVCAANPNTIVILSAGSSIRMPWLDRAAAVVQAWYLGQETGNAIASILFGEVNPSGKLPTTFPRRLEDNPAFVNYPGENGKVLYGEGLFVGYRYYDKKDIAPLFPFGYGLSYTTFEYRNLLLSTPEMTLDDELVLSVDVTNTGKVVGQEIVQVYVHDLESKLTRPDKELKAFAKVALAPGECKTVRLTLDREALSYYDPEAKAWVAEPGEFQVLVGASSRDIRATARFTLKSGG